MALTGLESIESLSDLTALCFGLGADSIGTITQSERSLSRTQASSGLIEQARQAIVGGQDFLGDTYCALKSVEARRPEGQTYTPASIVQTMLAWAGDQTTPARIVDPGVGSGRYALAAAQKFPEAHVVAADTDPLALLMTRATAAVLGVGERLDLVLGDYRSLTLPQIGGPTLFIGNPPYVRHHQIDHGWKRWFLDKARTKGLGASALAGLHVHFFLATALHARAGDYGAFITSSEWLDVNYGKLMRELLVSDFGADSIHVLDPESAPFADAQVTGTITCFKVGEQPESVKMRQVSSIAELGTLAEGREVSRARLSESTRWSVFTRVSPTLPEGYIELGELARVHRGAVTGANKVWVRRDGETSLPASVLFPSVTKARELFTAGDRLRVKDGLRVVIDLPQDLDAFADDERHEIERFLSEAKKAHVDEGYIASSRKSWYSVGLRAPAPILATYMARRPPAFVRNDVAARHINIAHGLYPREDMSEELLDNLARYLRGSVRTSQGRTYAGGLTKFEPREMERLPVPAPETLFEIGAL
ncbi:Eco57I restriction-modification methylase domain-containing protein [Serinicoccus chungangensis]|uniref:Eco57I restriction-modification methylase domain-containing protein n=1 Tax=Serinicoccus chungangensis TaxID=767452 RepID=UPI0019105554|nr:methyltransferase [Serinicoccus chungangensis]